MWNGHTVLGEENHWDVGRSRIYKCVENLYMDVQYKEMSIRKLAILSSLNYQSDTVAIASLYTCNVLDNISSTPEFDLNISVLHSLFCVGFFLCDFVCKPFYFREPCYKPYRTTFNASLIFMPEKLHQCNPLRSRIFFDIALFRNIQTIQELPDIFVSYSANLLDIRGALGDVLERIATQLKLILLVL